MLLALFLWLFCEFDEKVLDNLSLVKQKRVLSKIWYSAQDDGGVGDR